MLPLWWLTDPVSLHHYPRKEEIPIIIWGFSAESERPKEMNALASHVLHLTSCKDHKAKGWVSEVLNNELERICCKDSRRNYRPLFCLFNRKPLVAVTSDDEILHKHKYQGMHHLLALDSMEFCLDASPNRKLTSQELKSSIFSPCRWDANQVFK
ncbi:Melibiase family protein [Thalictrum thalictroides]|uniref:Melibiase family protein n=1 Tax=Thalictrum thalictroides TaxID=46969 RepID=A0A7J6W2Y5_THATH|nr:Melibiase family protein [Thalictrum thalictroides]